MLRQMQGNLQLPCLVPPLSLCPNHFGQPGRLPQHHQGAQVLAVLHIQPYVCTLAGAVEASKIMVASKMSGKVMLFLAIEATTQEAVEKRGHLWLPLTPGGPMDKRVQCTLDRWRDYHQALKSVKALVRETKGPKKQNVKNDQWAHSVHDALYTYGKWTWWLQGPLDLPLPGDDVNLLARS